MKCIVDDKGKIKRMSDAEALKRVAAGTHVYVGKFEWKQQGRGK